MTNVMNKPKEKLTFFEMLITGILYVAFFYGIYVAYDTLTTPTEEQQKYNEWFHANYKPWDIIFMKEMPKMPVEAQGANQ